MSDQPILRIHQTRSRANPGGMDVTKVLGEDVLPFRSRKPAWFKVPRPGSTTYRELSKTIADEGGTSLSFEADVTKEDQCAAIIKACVDEWGRVDILHNNVGIGSRDAMIPDLDEKAWSTIFVPTPFSDHRALGRRRAFLLMTAFAAPRMMLVER